MAVSTTGGFGISAHNGSGLLLQNNNLNQSFPGYYPTSNIGVIPPKGASHSHHNMNSIQNKDDPIIFTNEYAAGYNKGIFGKSDQYRAQPQLKPSPNLFNKNAFKNVVVGMLMWHFVSGYGSKYTIYNYYNQPENTQKHERFSKDMLLPCDVYSTILCGPQSQPICLKNDNLYCLADTSQIFRCNPDKTLTNCVNTTVFCLYENDPLCKNSTDPHEASVTVPCMSRVSLNFDMKNDTKNRLDTTSSTGIRAADYYTYCVILKAVADPKYKVERLQQNSNMYT